MTDPLRRELREELGKSLFGDLRLASDFFRDKAFAAIDDITPIIAREIARARAEEREEAATAVAAWRAEGNDQAWNDAIDTAVAAIRARGGE